MAHEVPDITLNNGVEMPCSGLGVFQTPPDETRDAVTAALDTGYRHIDTAVAYGNERQVGQDGEAAPLTLARPAPAHGGFPAVLRTAGNHCHRAQRYLAMRRVSVRLGW